MKFQNLFFKTMKNFSLSPIQRFKHSFEKMYVKTDEIQ